MSKIYIITEQGFEYNDEYLYEPSCEADNPVEAWHSKQMAEIECKRRNLERLRKEEIFGYGQPFSQFYGQPGFEELLVELGLDEHGYYDGSAPLADLSDENLERFYNLCSLRFHSVTPIDLQDD